MVKIVNDVKLVSEPVIEEAPVEEAVLVSLDEAVLVPEAPAEEPVLTPKEEKKVEKFVKASIATAKTVDPDSRWRVKYTEATSLHIGDGVFIRFVDGHAAVRGSELEAAQAAGAEIVEKL
jgi:hypothetical protein